MLAARLWLSGWSYRQVCEAISIFQFSRLDVVVYLYQHESDRAYAVTQLHPLICCEFCKLIFQPFIIIIITPITLFLNLQPRSIPSASSTGAFSASLSALLALFFGTSNSKLFATKLMIWAKHHHLESCKEDPQVHQSLCHSDSYYHMWYSTTRNTVSFIDILFDVHLTLSPIQKSRCPCSTIMMWTGYCPKLHCNLFYYSNG